MSYIDIAEVVTVGSSRKTPVWQVSSAQHGYLLGHVTWFGRWRQFAFFPEPETVYNHVCLTEIAEFCNAATRTHRQMLRERQRET